MVVAADDIVRMRKQLFFEGEDRAARTSRFWMLLTLAAIIAAAGVAGDSTATVIGAMIVAPLMAPILGVVLAMVLNDRENLVRCVLTVLLGVLAVIAIGFLIGLTKSEPVLASTNSQVAARVSPKLLDLLAALATGVVGSVALVRSDIGDTLPGVAIAISLVPPLTVVGLTLESGAPAQAWGATVLFLANVSAILATAVITMGIYGLLLAEDAQSRRQRQWSRPGVVVIGIFVLVVAVPLATTSARISRLTAIQSSVSAAAQSWADPAGWQVLSVEPEADAIRVRAVGPAPQPDPAKLTADLAAAGLSGVSVTLDLIPETRIELAPGG